MGISNLFFELLKVFVWLDEARQAWRNRFRTVGGQAARASFARRIKSLEKENPLAYIAPDLAKFKHSFQIKLPKCGAVMPVKGVHDQSYANWRAQITSMYGGALEFFFCVESADDPAYPHVERLIRENPEFQIQLLVAGVSWHCSQKIHNQLHGFERAMRSCEYVIVIDDDIKLHPGTIRAWVEELESDDRVLAASGYAFEYVGKGVTCYTSYFAMLWRCLAIRQPLLPSPFDASFALARSLGLAHRRVDFAPK